MQGQIQLKSYVTDEQFAVDGLPLLTASAKLPFWEGTGGGRFNRYYRAYSDAFLHYCRDALFPQAQIMYQQALESAGPLQQWRAVLDTKLTCQTAHIVSLYTDSVESGGDRRYVLRRGDTWNIDTGYPMALSDFFPPRSFWRRRLLEAAASQVQQSDPARYHPDWLRRLRRDFQPHHFYLTENGLCFFYQMYAVAPPTVGVVEFFLPYDSEKGPFPPTYFENKQ